MLRLRNSALPRGRRAHVQNLGAFRRLTALETSSSAAIT